MIFFLLSSSFFFPTLTLSLSLMKYMALLISVFAVLCVSPALSSVYYNNEFFERISSKDVVNDWNGNVDAHSFIKSSFSCENIHRYIFYHQLLYSLSHTSVTSLSFFSGRTIAKHLLYRNVITKIGDDWLNTETAKRPPTLVIVPSKYGPKTIVDIKYTDFSGIQDIPNNYPRAECYIVPPYKEVMYISMYSPSNPISVYAIRGNKLK